MKKRAIKWNEAELRPFSNPDEMLRILAELDEHFSKTKPTIVEVEGVEGDSMAIGLGGGDESLLSYIGAAGDPPYLHSVGQYESNDTLVYYYYGAWTEFSKGTLIPKNLALDVIQEFTISGQLSNKIQWEED